MSDIVDISVYIIIDVMYVWSTLNKNLHLRIRHLGAITVETAVRPAHPMYENARSPRYKRVYICSGE